MKTKNNKPLGNGHKPTELVMQANLELLPLIMNNIPQAVFWKDRDLVYLGCNQAFADDAGFSSPEDIVGKTDFDMPWKAQAELYRADDSLVMEKGEPKINYEEPQTTPSGSTIWLSTSKIPVRENGKVVAVLGMYEDVTARKQVETDLLLRDRALASSLNAVIILNLQDSKPIYVNDAILKMTGYTREEVMQFGLGDITGNPAAPKEIRAAIQTQGFFVGEELIKRKDGSVFPANFFSALITDDKGQPIAIQSTFFDISERKQAEESVRESEERFRRFTEATVEGLVFHEKGKIMDANPAALAMFGLSDSREFVGKNLLEFIIPESHKLVLQQMQLETVLPYEIQCIRADGATFPVETSTRTYKTGDRTIRASSIRDITERKRADAVVQESRARFQGLVETLSDWIWEVDQNGAYTYVSPKVTVLLGYEPEEILGKTPFDLMPPEEAQRVAGTFGPLFSTQQPLVALENINRHKDGHLVVFETSGVPFFDAQKQFKGYRGTDRDITERKQAEAALQQEKNISDITINSMPGIFYMFDAQGNLIRRNKNYDTVAGYSAGEPATRNALGAIAEEDRERASQAIQKAFTEGKAELEVLFKTRHGEKIPYFMSAARMTIGDNIYVVGTGIDLSERRRAEELLRQSEANLSSALRVANMGHWEFDVAAETFTLNDQYYSLHGMTAQEAGGYQIHVQQFAQKFVYPEDAAVVGQATQQAIETTDPDFHVQTEARILHVDGKPRWVSIWFRVEKDAQGRTIKLHGVNQDITERKQAENIQHLRNAFLQKQSAASTKLATSESVYGGNLKAALEEVCTIAADTLDVERASIWYYNEDQSKIRCMNLFEQGKGHSEGIELGKADFPAYFEALKSEEVIAANNAHTDPATQEFSEVYLTPLGINSMLDAPIRLHGRVIGVICNEHTGPARQWTLEEQNFASAIVNFVSSAMVAQERKRAEEELLRRFDVETLLTTISSKFVTVTQENLDQNVSQSLEMLGKFAGTDRSYLFRIADDGKTMDNTHEWCADEIEAHIDNLQRVPVDTFPWLMERFNKFEVVDIPVVTDMPLAAQAEKTEFQAEGIQSFIAVPIIYQNKLAGFMGFDAVSSQRTWESDTITVLRTVGETLITTIERIRLEKEVRQALERRGYEVQVSNEISQEVAAAPELNELFDRVVTLTKERLGYYHTQLLRYDATQDAVALVNGYGETGRKMLAGGHKMPLGSGLIGTAAATGETMMRSTLADDPDWQPNPLLPETKGEIAVPIKLGDQILGVLDVQSDKAGSLTEDDRLLLEGLCGQIAVAIEQTRLRQEMAERLEEVNRLYRSMSHEGWKTYRETANLPTGFVFDQTGTKPVEDVALADGSFTSVPMKVLGGETVGNLAVTNDPRRPMSQEDIDFLQQVSDQVALALEGARLSAQTQSALAQSEKLFESSRVLTQSADLQEMTATTVSMLDIPAINRAILATFNYDAQDNIESLDIVANWWNGTGHEITAIGTHYPYDVIRAMSFFISPTPVFFSDTHTDERVDATTMNLVERLNLRAVAVLPLYTGARQIGALILEAEVPHNFSQEETRLFTALAPQISTMLENRRQFERAQQQADRESTLNIISQKIQSATTVEAVLQIAARELGHALGAPMTIAQLSMKDKK